jgi:hypothetical protein
VTPTESLRSLMPSDIRRQWEEQDARNAKLAEELRQHCADALRRIADAMSYPSCSRDDLERASLHIAKALSVGAALDPE